MESLRLRGCVLFPDGVLRDGEVTIEGDSIVGVAEVESDSGREPTAAQKIIAPGFIDLQVNGAFGHDFTANPESIHAVAAALPSTGVTAFLPTIITSPLETYGKAFAALGPKATAALPSEARILGWHLEGHTCRRNDRARMIRAGCVRWLTRWVIDSSMTICV